MQLTQDQQKAQQEFLDFYNSNERYFIIEGYAGTGKTTLIKYLSENLPNKKYTPVFTATTNKAAEALANTVNRPVDTIHSLLKLYIYTDFKTGEQKLCKSNSAKPLDKRIIFIDEASYIDYALLNWIKKLTKSCKVVFMGDNLQLTPVKCSTTPAFDIECRKVTLNQVVRQSELSPIKHICNLLRDTIKGADFPKINLDNKVLKHLPKDEFEKEILTEYSKDDWTPDKSKVLAWTNQTVNSYNQLISKKLWGHTHFIDGDYAFNNHHVVGMYTDKLVKISSIEPDLQYDVEGYRVNISGTDYFIPKDTKLIKKTLNQYIKQGLVEIAKHISDYWCDLRPVYACTVNKSQGSTYDKVFIDLNDISKCKQNNTLARLLYVAISRAKNEVIFTGDIVS